jgi:hypothetical protein
MFQFHFNFNTMKENNLKSEKAASQIRSGAPVNVIARKNDEAIYLYKSILPLLAIIISLFFTACQQETNEEAIRKTIDDLHNEAMVVNEKAIKTTFKLDSLLTQKREQKDGDTVELQKSIHQLNLADEKMMDWMHDFQLDFKGSKTEALKYFKDQLDSVKQVQVQLEKAIEQAKPFIKQ